MPLLLYFPLIIWIGMVEIVQGEMLTRAKSKVPTPPRRR